MVVSPHSQSVTFEAFLKKLPTEYHKMAYEFKAFTRSRKAKTPTGQPFTFLAEFGFF